MRFNRTEPGIVLSSVAHAALFAFVIVGFSQPSSYQDQDESVPVEVVSESELRQMTRGDIEAKTQTEATQPRADRVAEATERKPDAQLGDRQVESPAGPPDAKEKADGEAEKAAEAKARAEAEAKAKADADAKAAQAAAERARQQAAERAKAEEKSRQEAAQRASEEEQERKDAEELRQRKALEVKQAAEAKARREAEAKALREKIEREQKEAEERKQAEAEKARKAAEARRVAEEKAKKAADDKAKHEAEAKAAAAQQAEQKPFNPLDIARLLQNKQPAQTTGSTAPQIQHQASVGAPTASAAKLSQSDRDALIAFLQERMERCISYPAGSDQKKRPEVRVILARDGSLAAPPALIGGDRAIGEAAVRGIRRCAPYAIPERFAAMYEDWRDLVISIDTSGLR
ncbi:MAG: cell envelope integrity protein TolA [Beijerinckiaceae bacterium]